jgi:metallo-beta-lactamase class B
VATTRARRALRGSIVALACVVAARGRAQVVADAAIECPPCVEWNVPQQPFRIFGNTYYVGTAELAAILVVDDEGLVLLDAALPQSAPLIDASIAALGFKTADIRLIVNSHTHFDHAGGMAALQRASGAMVAASPRALEALRAGKPNPDDPQFTIANNEFPRVANVRAIGDGETVSVGDVRLMAHFTPGHTPGSTTWTWRSCEESRCLDIVYADSLNPVSADEFRFTGSASMPSIVASFERSIGTVEALPCDILLSPHPGFFGMQEKLRRNTADANAFVDANACRAYAGAARRSLEQRIARETAPAARP